jgi:predicted AlkP superfamily phosphohydrolase/phosphomutase
LDGASFTALDYLMDSGAMPFLKRFTEAGARGELMSTPCPVTPPAWTTIMTGRSPGNHGIFDFIQVEEDCSTDRLAFRLVNARDILCETIWSVASRNGRKVSSLNFPVMFQAAQFDGCMVPGFVTPRLLRTSSHPKGIWDRLKGNPDIDLKAVGWDLEEGRKPLTSSLDEEEFGKWVGYLQRKERGWGGIALDSIREMSCDLVAVVFEGVDRLQHQAWKHIDPALTPNAPTPEDVVAQRRCISYYGEVDRQLEALVRAAGEDVQVFIVSDHGFGSTTEIFYLNTWLEREGHLNWKGGVEDDEEGLLTAQNMREQFDSIDWTRTNAYARTTSANGVYIRVAKEPGDCGVRPENYMSFRAELARRLAAFTDPVDGRPVVAKIETREDAFPGVAMEEAPDLTLTLRDGGFVSILKHEQVLRRRPEVKGTHRPNGVLIAGGSGIQRGITIPTTSVIDVAPTVLHSLGLGVPEDLEGRVVTEVYESLTLERDPVASAEPTIMPKELEALEEVDELQPDEESMILDKLRSLGYME